MAISLLPTGNFEDGGSAWTLTMPNDGIEAYIVNDAARARFGDYCLGFFTWSLIPGGSYNTGLAQSPAINYWPGKEHTLTLYAKQETINARMRFRAWEDPSTQLETSGTIAITNDYAAYSLTFTPTAATGYITVGGRSNGATNHRLVVDDIDVTLPEVTPVAYLGPELAVAAMLDMIQDNIAAELAEIVLERNDSLAFPATTADAVFNRPADAFVASVLQLEVFTDESGFPVIERDLSTWQAATPQVTTDVGLTVRLRIANRADPALSPVDMSKITQRYAAALVRLIRNDPQLANGGSALVNWARPEAMRISRTSTPIDEDVTQFIDNVEIDVTVNQTETNANEGIVGGGTAAAFSGGLGL